MIAAGVMCGLMVGWFACSLCKSAALNDTLSALGLAGVELDALRKERDSLLHATRTQFKKREAL